MVSQLMRISVVQLNRPSLITVPQPLTRLARQVARRHANPKKDRMHESHIGVSSGENCRCTCIPGHVRCSTRSGCCTGSGSALKFSRITLGIRWRKQKRSEMNCFVVCWRHCSQSTLPSRAQSSWFKLQSTLPKSEESYRDCALAFPSGVVQADSLQSLKYRTAGDSCAASQYMLGTIC